MGHYAHQSSNAIYFQQTNNLYKQRSTQRWQLPNYFYIWQFIFNRKIFEVFYNGYARQTGPTELIWNLIIGLSQDFSVFPSYKYLCCHCNQSWKVIFMKLKQKIQIHGWYIWAGIQSVRWLRMKCHLKILLMTVTDNLLVCCLANLFIDWPWPLAFTEVNVVPTFISQPTIVLKNYNVSLFPIQNPKGPNLTLMKNGSWSTYSHHLNKLVVLSPLMLHIKFKAINLEKKVFWGFYHILYDQRSHLGNEIWATWINFRSHPKMLHIRFHWKLPSISEKSFGNTDKHSIPVTFRHGHWMTLTIGTGIYRGSSSTYFHITEYHCFGKMQCITFSPFNSPRDQIWPWQKWGKVNLGSPFEKSW